MVFSGAILAMLGSLGLVWRAPLGLALTIAAAMLSHRLVERPFLRLKERFTYVSSAPPRPAPTPAAPIDTPTAQALPS